MFQADEAKAQANKLLKTELPVIRATCLDTETKVEGESPDSDGDSMLTEKAVS